MVTNTIKMLMVTIAIAFVLFFLSRMWFIVHPGETKIQMRMGAIKRACSEPGTYFALPFIDKVVAINNQINKAIIDTIGLTKDLQTVSVEVAINYRITDAINIYKCVGSEFENVIINPFAQETIKAIVAKFTAEDLIISRHTAKQLVFDELKERLVPVYIEFIDFNFVHLDFSKEFMHSVEEKQIAEQSAKTAKNLTVKITEESQQIKTRADAEAYALHVKKSSVTKELVELKRIEKWDGKLPKITGSSNPFISLRDLDIDTY